MHYISQWFETQWKRQVERKRQCKSGEKRNNEQTAVHSHGTQAFQSIWPYPWATGTRYTHNGTQILRIITIIPSTTSLSLFQEIPDREICVTCLRPQRSWVECVIQGSMLILPSDHQAPLALLVSLEVVSSLLCSGSNNQFKKWNNQ